MYLQPLKNTHITLSNMFGLLSLIIMKHVCVALRANWVSEVIHMVLNWAHLSRFFFFLWLFYVHKRLTFTWCKPVGQTCLLTLFSFWVNGGGGKCTRTALFPAWRPNETYLICTFSLHSTWCTNTQELVLFVKSNYVLLFLDSRDVLCSFTFCSSGLFTAASFPAPVPTFSALFYWLICLTSAFCLCCCKCLALIFSRTYSYCL